MFTHLARAGHLNLLEQLAPGGVLLIPAQVHDEIESGRQEHRGIPDVGALTWVRLAILTDEEEWTLLAVKAELGGGPTKHLGEAGVIAVAHHRGCVALIDERAARTQAIQLGVPTVDTLWLVIEAHKQLFGRDRRRTVALVDDLLETGMWLPLSSGEEIISFAYQEGWLPE